MVAPQPSYFATAHGPTFAWYHAPAEPALDLGVVLCPPIGSELMCSYYPLRQLARALAGAGIAVLRADYHGTGDAAGYDDDPDRVAAWLGTIDRAIDELRAHGAARVGLVGLRLGATLAAIAAARRDDVACAALWAPCRTGRAFTRELKLLAEAEARAEHVTAVAPGAIEAGGFLLTAATVGELAALDLTKLGRPVAPRTLMIGRDDVAADHKLAAALGATYVDWPGYAKMMLAPHYAQPAPETFGKLAAWLRDGAAPAPRAVVERIAEPSVELGDGVRERAIRFGPDGAMFGVLAEPAAGPRGATAVVLANTGANYHVGPNRLYVRMARQWAARGMSVLRFDLGGIGDSEPRGGHAPNVPYADTGIADLELGIAEARARSGARAVAAVGLCSGAYVAFHAGLRGSPLDAQVLVNPQTFYWKDGDSLDAAPAMVVERVDAYRASARSWASWKKLLTGRAQYRALARTLMRRAYDLGETRLKRVGRRLGVVRLREDLGRDLKAIVDRGIATLIVYSENDAGIVYLKQRVDGELADLTRTGRFKIETIAAADHTFTGQAAQRRLIDVMTAYLASMS